MFLLYKKVLDKSGPEQYYLETHVQLWKSEQQFKVEEKMMGRLVQFMGSDIPIREFRTKHINQYITWRKKQPGRNKKNVTNSTVNADIGVLSAFLNWAIDNEFYEGKNPALKKKLPTHDEREINLTSNEIREIINVSKDYAELEVFVWIALFTGMRKSEILSLIWKDVDLKNCQITIRNTQTKSKKGRKIPFPPILQEYLSFRAKGVKSDMPVITIGKDAIRNRWHKLRNRLSFSIPDDLGLLRIHDIRHIYAQSLRNSGIPSGDIAAFLGHSNSAITERRYAQAGGHNGQEKVKHLEEYYDFNQNNDSPSGQTG